jgi:hypothetical protein
MNTPFVRRFCTFLMGIALLLIASVPPVSPVHAANSLAVIPPRFELFGAPGDTVVDKLRIRNDSDTTANYTIEIEDFKAKDDEGGVDLLDPNSTENSTYRLARWVTVEPSHFTVAAGTERILDVTVKIPKDAEPGGHFASILVRQDGNPNPGEAAVDTRVGSLVLLRVAGAITESASLDYFKAENSFAQYGPVTLALRTKNDGNVHVAPRGTIVITNMFGQKVAELPLTSANVLPGSARIARTVWDQKNLIGRYTATLVAQYGENNGPDNKPHTMSATTTFYILPLYIVWIVLALVVILFLLITQRRKVKKFLNRLTSD